MEWLVDKGIGIEQSVIVKIAYITAIIWAIGIVAVKSKTIRQPTWPDKAEAISNYVKAQS